MSATSSMEAGPTAGAACSAASGHPEQANTETPGVFAEVSRVAAAARDTFAGFLHLVTLEAQRAGVALVWMLGGAVAAALLAVTGWLALVAALAMWVVSLGFPPIATALVIAVVSVGVAGALIYMCIAMSRALLFPATQRQLTGKPPGTAVS